ncbi:MAG: nucleotidyltransferase family protein [Clostridia bacterium]|nr:nucleotidyltransferase family protein [Clostridia bacterium]
MNQIIELFINLLRSEICRTPVPPDMLQQITPETLEQLYALSRKQDMTHIPAVALKKLKLLSDDRTAAAFRQSMYHALVRYETMENEKNKIFRLFEDEEIVFVPLKGAVIRKYYPEEWMRTSCDIDILVHEEDLEHAKNALVSALGYTVQDSKYHDIAMYSPDGMLLELHFSIKENMENIDRCLERVWDFAKPAEADSFRYEMTPEYLLFHAFAHMLYHFTNGGCGVKFVTDIFLLEQNLQIDRESFHKMCEECRILTFAENVEKLAAVWYGEAEHDDITARMEQYIIEGGVFGSMQTRVTARKTKAPGQAKYIFQRIFIPYREFCASYPKLEKYPFLYPYYTVKRWCRITDKDKAKTALQEYRVSSDIQQDKVNELMRLFRDLDV